MGSPPFQRAVIPNHRLIAVPHEAAPPVKVGSPKIFSAYGLDRKKILGGLDRQADRDKSPVGSCLIAALSLRLRAAARRRHRCARFRPAGRSRAQPTPGARAGRLGGRHRAPCSPKPLAGQFWGFAKYKRFLRNVVCGFDRVSQKMDLAAVRGGLSPNSLGGRPPRSAENPKTGQARRPQNSPSPAASGGDRARL